MAKSLFGGKETYKEEFGEAKAVAKKKITPAQFVKGEKSEGHKEEPGMKGMAKKLATGKVTPTMYAKKEAKEPKKMAYGGLAGQTDMPNATSGVQQPTFGQPVPPAQGLNLGTPTNPPVNNTQSQNPNTGMGSMRYPVSPQPQTNLPGVGIGRKKGGVIKVKKLAKGGFVRAADGAAKRGRTKGRTL